MYRSSVLSCSCLLTKMLSLCAIVSSLHDAVLTCIVAFGSSSRVCVCACACVCLCLSAVCMKSSMLVVCLCIGMYKT